MISVFYIALIGALANRVRGGFATDFLRKINLINDKQSVPAVKIFHDLVFAISFFIALKIHYTFFGFLAFIVMFFSMMCGRSFGWGGYIAGMIDKKIDHNRRDVKFIDYLFLKGDNNPVLRCWAALSVRGLMWSFCLCSGFYAIKLLGFELSDRIIFILPSGLLMGSAYFLAITICDKLTFRGNGWQYGELLWGAILWGSCFYLTNY